MANTTACLRSRTPLTVPTLLNQGSTMVQGLFAALLAVASMATQAASIPFFDTQFDVTAVAISDGVPDAQGAASVSDAAFADAASVGTFGVATAGAFSGDGLLSSSADVSGSDGISSAASTAHFIGSFVNEARVLLNIDFQLLSFASGSGGGDTTLYVTLRSGTTTLFNDFISAPMTFDYAAEPGSISVLELTLTTEANAGFLLTGPGSYSAQGTVVVSSVPEPGQFALLALGLLAVGVAVRARRRFEHEF